MAITSRANSIIPTLDALSSGTTFIYDVTLSSSTSHIQQNESFFIIYDFAGYTGASESLTGNWSITPELTSTLPAGINVTPPTGDSGSLMNIRFTYTGPSLTLTGPPDLLGTVTLNSLYTIRTKKSYVGYDRDNETPPAPEGNNGRVTVAAVPLPPALWAGLSLMGLMGVQGVRRQRLNKAGE